MSHTPASTYGLCTKRNDTGETTRRTREGRRLAEDRTETNAQPRPPKDATNSYTLCIKQMLEQ